MNARLVMATVLGLALAVTLSAADAYAASQYDDDVLATTGKPETMIAPAIPLIVGLGVGLAYFIGISARGK